MRRNCAHSLCLMVSLVLLLSFGSAVSAETCLQLGGRGDDGGRDVHVDAVGNVYLAGCFTGTVDFDPGPDRAERTSTVADERGRPSTDIFLAKYDPEGRLLWVRALGGDGADMPRRLAVSTAGELYVAGCFSGTVDFDPADLQDRLDTASSGAGRDGFLAKYATDGQFVWVRTFGDEDWADPEVTDARRLGRPRMRPDPELYEDCLDLALDGRGNVCLTGVFNGRIALDPESPRDKKTSIDKSPDGFFASYDADGRLRWAGTFGGAGRDQGQAIGIAADGSVFVGGFFSGTAEFNPRGRSFSMSSRGGADAFLAKFDADGGFLGAVAFGGVADDQVRPGGVAVSKDGVYVAGDLGDAAVFGPGGAQASHGGVDAFVARYSVAGAYVWSVPLGGEGIDIARRVTVDAAGDIYVTGLFHSRASFGSGSDASTLSASGSGGASDVFVAKYSPLGRLLWARSFGAPVSGSAFWSTGEGLAADAAGLLVTGRFFGTADFDPGPARRQLNSAGDADIFLVRLSPDGALAK